MKMLTVSLLVCAMMALTAAADVPEAEKNETVVLIAVPEAESNVTVVVTNQDEDSLKVKTAATCPSGWTEYNDRCYMYVSTHTTWAEAEKHCLDRGGHLASVHSFEEQAEIQDMIFKVTHERPLTWLGGYDAGQRELWFWSDGTSFDFTYWDDGQPDGSGNCLLTNFGGDHKNDDQPCYYKKPSVCARKK